MLDVIAGADPSDPATAPAAAQACDYTAFLDAAGLEGARLGVWREGGQGANATTAVLDAAIAVLRHQGAKVIDPVQLADSGKINEPEFTALLRVQAGHQRVPGGARRPRSRGRWPSSSRSTRATPPVLRHFGQEMFEQAEATSGDPADPGHRSAHGEATRPAREAWTRRWPERLDAVIALTGNPAWLTDHVLGDHNVSHVQPGRSGRIPGDHGPGGRSPACRSACPSSAQPGASHG